MSIIRNITQGFLLQRFLILIGVRPRQRRLLKQARALYHHIVAQARQPIFYRDWGIRDDKDGRFEMLSLHLFLVLNRLRLEPCDNAEDDIALLGQFLSEVAVADLEYNLREMGVGDLAVGKRVQKMTKRHYARMEMYRTLFDSATDTDDAARQQTLIEYVFGDDQGFTPLQAGNSVPQLVRYIQHNQKSLAAQSIFDVIDRPEFRQP